jgi:hypothetical protein
MRKVSFVDPTSASTAVKSESEALVASPDPKPATELVKVEASTSASETALTSKPEGASSEGQIVPAKTADDLAVKLTPAPLESDEESDENSGEEGKKEEGDGEEEEEEEPKEKEDGEPEVLSTEPTSRFDRGQSGGRLPILVSERAAQGSGLWYPRQEGVIKGGDGRFDSPYIVGTAQIRQVRDVLKVRTVMCGPAAGGGSV